MSFDCTKIAINSRRENQMQVFQNEEFGSIRTIEINGEPWFVGQDVARALGYGEGKSLANAVANHVDAEDKGVTEMMTPGGKQNMTIINESGLYALVLSSKLPTAKKFKRWVTSEVLPSIRKTGGYMMPQDYPSALRALADAEEAKLKLLSDNRVMQPKAQYFDALVERNTLTNFRETAKELGASPKKFVAFLLDHKYLYRDQRGKLLPYEAKNDGLFTVKECKSDKTPWSGTQTLVTPKGRETFRLLMACR